VYRYTNGIESKYVNDTYQYNIMDTGRRMHDSLINTKLTSDLLIVESGFLIFHENGILSYSNIYLIDDNFNKIDMPIVIIKTYSLRKRSFYSYGTEEFMSRFDKPIDHTIERDSLEYLHGRINLLTAKIRVDNTYGFRLKSKWPATVYVFRNPIHDILCDLTSLFE